MKRNESVLGPGTERVVPDGSAIAAARHAVGWTQRRLREKSGVPERTIQRMESSAGDQGKVVRIRRDLVDSVLIALKEACHDVGRSLPSSMLLHREDDCPVKENRVGESRRADLEFAISKVNADYDHSCLQTAETLKAAIDRSRKRVETLVEEAGKSMHSVFGQRPDLLAARTARSEEARRSIERVRQHARHTPIRVSNECIATGSLATWISLSRRHDIELALDYEDASGREQMIEIDTGGSEYDFVVTAEAPFVMTGHSRSLDYRHGGALFREKQHVLEHSGKYDWPSGALLVYQDSSALEQLLIQGDGLVGDREPIYISTLSELIERCYELRASERILAWEPLASGLRERFPDLHPVGRPYLHQISLAHHHTWESRSLDRVRRDLMIAFSFEWTYCDQDRDWAEKCISEDHSAVGFSTETLLSRISVGGGLLN